MLQNVSGMLYLNLFSIHVFHDPLLAGFNSRLALCFKQLALRNQKRVPKPVKNPEFRLFGTAAEMYFLLEICTFVYFDTLFHVIVWQFLAPLKCETSGKIVLEGISCLLCVEEWVDKVGKITA